jgi:glucokinase
VTKSIGTILVGEVFDHDVRLALCGLDLGAPTVVLEERSAARSHRGLGSAVNAFLQKHRPPRIRTAAFVVTGPVHDGVSLAGSAPWPVDAEALAAELGIKKVTLLNDVEAMAYGIPASGNDDLVVLSKGDAHEYGNHAVVAAGPHPGMSGSFWNGTEHVPFMSDGVHADFAPSCEDERQLGLHLGPTVARVTVELLLSTAGLELIYLFLRARASSEEPAGLANAMRDEGATTVILREGTTGGDLFCQHAVERYLAILGSAAGNFALTVHATGGVYLAGSILSTLGPSLQSGIFQQAFTQKAPMQPLLSKIPVYAMLSDRAALLGAATVAAREMRERHAGGWAS